MINLDQQPCIYGAKHGCCRNVKHFLALNITRGLAELSDIKVLSDDGVGTKKKKNIQHILKHLHSLSHAHQKHIPFYCYSAKTPSPVQSTSQLSQKDSSRFASIAQPKTRQWIQASPCLSHRTVQSTFYIICSVRVCIQVCECMCVCVKVCLWSNACASMWPSGECVACSHARGPDRKCCTCMWWLIATRHNRTLKTKPNRTQAWFLYLGTHCTREEWWASNYIIVGWL